MVGRVCKVLNKPARTVWHVAEKSPRQFLTVKIQRTLATSRNLCHNIGLLSRARVVKLVDAGDSKSPAARRAGSIPAPGTIGNSLPS